MAGKNDSSAIVAAPAPGVFVVPEKNNALVPFALGKGTLYDAMTGQELPAALAELFAGTDALDSWNSVQVNGFMSPLCGNQIIGLVRSVGSIDSVYNKAGRTIYTIEGAASQYAGDDAAMLTKAKEDPAYDPEKWITTTGNWIVGEMAAMKGLDRFVGRWVRIAFGPYAKGARSPKRLQIDVAPENDPRIKLIAAALNMNV